MNKETLIELRAKYLFSKQFPHSIWDNVHDGTREVYLAIASEEVEWFIKKGLGTSEPLIIPNRQTTTEGFSKQFIKGYESAISDFKSVNPNSAFKPLSEKPKIPQCYRCGCEDTKENPVYLAPDDYDSEINDDHTEVWECSKCRQERRDDI